MAFKLYQMDTGITPPIEYMPATANEVYAVGEALKIASGAVTKCSGTTAPALVCAGPAKDGNVPCVRVQKYMVFGTTLSAAPGEGVTLVPGTKVTIATDGMQVTATTTSGVAEIVAIEGQTVGSVVHVRF